MQRNYSTGTSGGQFTATTVSQVWSKAFIVPGYDATKFRKDRCGAWISFDAYGTTGAYGWEIDHEHPVAKGGSDALSNLQPLHWQNNRGKGDSWPNWTCAITSR